MLRNNSFINKKSQITLFIIFVIVIVALIFLFFIFKGKIISSNIPKNFEPVYTHYLSCIDYEAKNGALILGETGGHIKETSFSPGSIYMPFSSHLGFLGNAIPYWYYVSGNGLVYEKIPSINDMQDEISEYIEQNILRNCDFSYFEKQGYEINLSEAIVTSEIKENVIISKVKQNIEIKYDKKSWTGKNHIVETKSNLGKFYNLAIKIYNHNKKNMFLEKYGVDILRLYAPVDGVEISCSPKIWFLTQVRENLIQALEANIPKIKIDGDYYRLENKDNKYYVQNIGEKTPFNVNFMYSRYWPMKIEVWPSEDNVLRADPVGIQEGLGILGFCYVPYHFVYDFHFPVLIQIYSQGEIFQFPVVVIIDKNQPRKALDGSSGPNIVPDLCLRKNTKITIYTYNNSLSPIPARIKFKCFDNTCYIGEVSGNGAPLISEFPQCGNGYIIASSDGYETRKELISTINEGSYNIFLDKKYKLSVEVRNKGNKLDKKAIITFSKENGTSTTVSYPDVKEIELTEGEYKVVAYIYTNTSLYLKGGSMRKCVDVPKSNIFGFFGITEEKCFDMQIPGQTIDMAIAGGGTQKTYFPESRLSSSKKLIIEPEFFNNPKKIEDLQTNFNLVDISHLNFYFEENEN
ncbi:MAG: hypothetical protein QXW97_02070 [Candidatus Pacearchaeota archaeon]